MFKSNIERLLNEIDECVIKSGRGVGDVKLVAITKTHSVETIREALECGIRYIGESRVQESLDKIPALMGRFDEFHFVGYLQSNKINKLLSLRPVLIHSIDKFSTAERLDEAIKRMNSGDTEIAPTIEGYSCNDKVVQDILIEVNTSGEGSKNGVRPSEVSELIKRIDDLEYVNVKGLMTIGALTEDEGKIRKCFSTLKDIFEKEKSVNYRATEMKYLSMGMSGDYKIAIQEGANIIRLGSVIFGTR